MLGLQNDVHGKNLGSPNVGSGISTVTRARLSFFQVLLVRFELVLVVSHGCMIEEYPRLDDHANRLCSSEDSYDRKLSFSSSTNHVSQRQSSPSTSSNHGLGGRIIWGKDRVKCICQ